MTDREVEVEQHDGEQENSDDHDILDKDGVSEREQMEGDSDSETSSGEDTERSLFKEKFENFISFITLPAFVSVASDAVMALSGALIGVEVGLYLTIRYSKPGLTVSPIFWAIFLAICASFLMGTYTKFAYLKEEKE